MMYRMILAILALTAVTASNADHSELMEKQKNLMKNCLHATYVKRDLKQNTD